MNTQQFLQYINEPASLDQQATKELEQLVAEYPAFHAAQVLLAKAYKNLHDHRFEKQLKKAAIHTGDRALLFDYLQEAPVQLDPLPPLPAEEKKSPIETVTEPENIASVQEVISNDPLVVLEGENLLDESTQTSLNELSIPETLPVAGIPAESKIYSPLPNETPEFCLTCLDDDADAFERPTFVSETVKNAVDIEEPVIQEETISNSFTTDDDRPTYVEPEDIHAEDVALTEIPETGLPSLPEMPGQSPSELPVAPEPEEEPEEAPEEEPEEGDTDPFQPSHSEITAET